MIKKAINSLLLLIFIFPAASFSTEAAGMKSEIYPQKGHTRGVWSVCFSPDGKYALSGSEDSTMVLWDIKTGREIRRFAGHADLVSSVAYMPDGKSSISASYDNSLRLWDVYTGKTIRIFSGHTGYVNSVAVLPDGRSVLSAGNDKSVRLWEISTGREIKIFLGHKSHVLSVAVSPDGEYALSGGGDASGKDASADCSIILWDLKTGNEMKRFAGHSAGVMSLAFSPDGKSFVSAGQDKSVILRDIGSGKKIWWGRHKDWVNTVSFSKSGRNIVSGSWDFSVRIWDVQSGKELKRFASYSSAVMTAVYSDNEMCILSGYRNSFMRLFDADSGKVIRLFSGHTPTINELAVLEDGRHFLTGNSDSGQRLWDLSSGEQKGFYQVKSGCRGWINGLALSPDQKSAFSCSCWEGDIRQWDIFTGRLTSLIRSKSPGIEALAASPDGKYLLASPIGKNCMYDEHAETPIFLFDAASGKLARKLEGHTGNVNGLHFSPDSRYAVSEGADRTVRMWDITTGKEIRNYRYNDKETVGISFQAAGPDILIGRENGEISLVDFFTGREIRKFPGHTDGIASLTFSDDGLGFVSSSRDGTIRYWNLKDGLEKAKISTNTSQIRSIAFSEGNRFILTGNTDGAVCLFDAETGSEVASLIGFSDGEWIAITPEGYYNSSQGGEKYLNVRIGNRVYGIDNFRQKFFRPDILKYALKGNRLLKIPNIYDAGLPPDVAFLSMPQVVAGQDIAFSVRLADNGSGIGDVRVYLNDVGVKAEKIDRTGDIEREYSIKVSSGENRINVQAFNRSNWVRSNDCERTVRSDYRDGRKPSFYAIVAGVGSTTDQEFMSKQLDERVIDTVTTGLKDVLAEKAGSTFGKVKIELLRKPENTDRKSIESELSKMEDIYPEDVFLFCITSHGTTDKNGNYYLITSKERIGTDDLRNLLIDIPSTKKLVILNTCESGAFVETKDILRRTSVMDADDAKRLISRETGFPIFSASERGGYASGNLFIEAISMGLKRNRHDGAIKVSDLEKSIKKEMPIIVDDYNRKLKAFCIKQKNADCYEKNKAEMTPVIFPGASDFEITGSAKGKQR